MSDSLDRNFEDVMNEASTVALASPKEIEKSKKWVNDWENKTEEEKNEYKEKLKRKGRVFYPPRIKSGKLPAISWKKYPIGYNGFNDTNYGSGVICSYIQSIGYYLAVIDLDTPKEDDDIPLEDLLQAVEHLIPQTVTHRTPSGGYHIYLLSMKQPKASQPSFNLDYQTNTGNRKGKYVVGNFRYAEKTNDKGEKKYVKEYYEKCEDSPDTIMVVNNSDNILQDIYVNLKELGVLVTPSERKNQKRQDKLVSILAKNYRTGSRNDYSLAIAGYLYKNNYPLDKTLRIVSLAFHDDEEISNRLNNVHQTYNKNVKDVSGWNALKKFINPQDQQAIKKIISNGGNSLKDKIFSKIGNNQEPSINLVADYVNSKKELYFDNNSLKYYEAVDRESLKEIDVYDIVNFCNDEFGFNTISKKICRGVFQKVTRLISKDYNLVEFKNGTLFTNDGEIEFKKDYHSLDKVPKIKLEFNWNPEANGGEIESMLDDRLSTDKVGFEDNKITFMKALGSAFMSTNEIGKMVILVGRPATGKSTIMTILKRIFNYSEVPIPTILKNERFTLYPSVDKDINIDDDIQSGVLKGIGKLNTFITGNGGSVEKKGENEHIQLSPFNTPRIFGCGNALPPVVGDGFKRRILMIIVDNLIDENQMRNSFQSDILVGKKDEEIEWLIYTAITIYQKNRDKPIISKRTENFIMKEWEEKSYPLKKAIETIFDSTLDKDESPLFYEEDYLTVREVNRHIKRWFKWALATGVIFDEHKTPSTSQISKAMSNSMFEQGQKFVQEENGNRTTIRIYKDIEINHDWISSYKSWKASS
jgi:hypothetical protein